MLLLMRAVAFAVALQSGSATITGIVRNSETSVPLAGAVVAMADEHRSTVTDATGRYVFRDIAAGPHHIGVRSLGFVPRTLHALTPHTGLLEISVSLSPLNTRLATLVVRQSVSAHGRAVDASSTGVERARTIDVIRNSPLSIEPDVLQSLVGGSVAARPESPNGLHVRGGATDHVAYTLDGVPVFSPYHAAGMFSGWNPDAVDYVALRAAVMSVGDPGALSGTVQAATREPGDQLQSRGVLSTTQVNISAAGPVGVRDARFLLGVRAGYPAASAPLGEASYVRGGTGDRILTFDATAAGGHLHLLGYDSEDEISASSTVDSVPRVDGASPRNAFIWGSRSVGAEWTRRVGSAAVRVLAWNAGTAASAAWAASNGPLRMASSRRDLGFLTSVRRRVAGSPVTAGVRLERSVTRYRVDFAPDSVPDFAPSASTSLATVFVVHEASLGSRTTLESAASVTAFGGRVYSSPRAQLTVRPSANLTVYGSYARQHQYAQSVRNTESVTGNVFPVELYLGAGSGGAPVARSTQQLIGAAFRPTEGAQVSAQAHRVQFADVILVAASDGEPFATRAFGVGSGASHGISVEASITARRFGAMASYGWQRVVYAADGARYVPEYAAVHVLQSGVNFYPTSTTSIRIGVVGEAGRHTSAVSGAFEWEACNLRDRGCEFGGSPRSDPHTIGATAVPLYARADLSVRKHWHAQFRSTDAVIAVYGTVSNVFGRDNVLTYSRGASPSTLEPVQMRPFAPLVLGLEWRF